MNMNLWKKVLLLLPLVLLFLISMPSNAGSCTTVEPSAIYQVDKYNACTLCDYDMSEPYANANFPTIKVRPVKGTKIRYKNKYGTAFYGWTVRPGVPTFVLRNGKPSFTGWSFPARWKFTVDLKSSVQGLWSNFPSVCESELLKVQDVWRSRNTTFKGRWVPSTGPDDLGRYPF